MSCRYMCDYNGRHWKGTLLKLAKGAILFIQIKLIDSESLNNNSIRLPFIKIKEYIY